MNYFIGYLMRGEAADWHRGLMKDISEKFNTGKLHEKSPPHITIFYPFEREDIEPVKELLRAWARSKKIPGNFDISDFGRFDDRVIFTKVDVGHEVRGTVEELQAMLHRLPHMPQSEFPVWNPHATLANRLSPREINQIGEYIRTLKKPSLALPFDNVTLFKLNENQVWIIDETFEIGRI